VGIGKAAPWMGVGSARRTFPVRSMHAAGWLCWGGDGLPPSDLVGRSPDLDDEKVV